MVLRFPSDDYRLSLLLLFEIASGAILAALIWKVNKFIGLFLIMAIVSRVYPTFSRQSYMAYWAIMSGCIWYYCLTQLRPDVNTIYNAMCIAVIINCILLVLQSFELIKHFPVWWVQTILEGGKQNMPVGLLGNQNLSSALIAVCFPAFLREKWLYLIPIPLAGLILSKTTGGVMSLAVGMIVFAWIKGVNVWIILSVIGIACLYLLIDPPGRSVGERIGAWKIGAVFFSKNWLTGWGIGHWKVLFKNINYGGHWWVCAHNEPVQMTVEMGSLFPLVLLGYVVSTVRKFLADRDLLLPFIAIIISGVNSLVNFPFHVATTAIVIITWMAIFDYEKV